MKTTTMLVLAVAFMASVFSAQAAPKSSAPFEKALKDAEMIASLNPAWSIQRTSGASMGEFFGDNSLIIVQKASLEDIRVGMMIVYRSSEGELISHKVTARDGDAVRTMGTANRNMDPEPVTADMIVGTIFCVFHSKSAPTGEVYASSGEAIPTALCKSY